MRGQHSDHHCSWREEAERLQARVEELESTLEQSEQLRARVEELESTHEQSEQLRARVEELESTLEQSEQLHATVSKLEAELQTLRRQVFGKKSEKIPRIKDELRQKSVSHRDPKEAQKRRRENAEARELLHEREVRHELDESRRLCPNCDDAALQPVGEGTVSYLVEYIPPRFERQKHIQQTLACPCCDFIVTAEGPAKVVEKGGYGPGFLGHLITSKCGDSIPLYRLEKQYKRLGIPISRSTMTDLYHAAAERLEPIYERLVELIAKSDIVQADETVLKVQAKDKARRAYMWTFLSDDLIAYRFSPSRSGKTPAEVLGTTKGALVVDAYTGYNRVTTPDGRTRAGCLAHTRRKFFDAISTAPEAREALDLILEVYRVEHEAKARDIVRSGEHLELRESQSKGHMERLHSWLLEQQPLHPPRSPMGKAISYALNNWEPLTQFLDDVRLPVDNNASERALRVVALGRKNFLFVGHDDAGQNTAVLYSLVSTCEANDVNPQEYLADVLFRVQTHPHSRIDELLPQNWNPPDKTVSS
jgi:transposase